MSRCRCRDCKRHDRRHHGSKGNGVSPRAAIAAVVVVFAMAGAAGASSRGHHHHGSGGTLDSLGTPPSAGDAYPTRESWARAFLRDIPELRTPCNVAAVVAWETAEGGGFGNQAENNPLNVNPGPGTPWPGYAATGAWAFPDEATGIKYSVLTIKNGNYGAILAALAQGRSAQAVATAIENSPWAASHYGYSLTATC